MTKLKIEQTNQDRSARDAERVEDVLERIGVPVRDDRLRSRFGEHVRVHKYFLDRTLNRDTDLREAAASWNVNVLKPLREAVDSAPVKGLFPGKNPDELVAEVSDHWHFMKQERPDASPDDAAEDFARRFGSRVARGLGVAVLARAIRRWKEGSRRADRIEANLRRYRTSQELKTVHWPF